MIEIKYPIFLQDSDKYMYMINSKSEVNNELEIPDIEDGEFCAWDREGRPLELYLHHKKIKVKIASNDAEKDRLKEVIREYAKKYAKRIKRGVPFFPSCEENNIVELFKTVDERVKTKSFFDKAMRLINPRKRRRLG